jgi:hypothetical protein
VSQIHESIANFGAVLHKSARDQERMRIIAILADKICLDNCQHAVCRELTHTIKEINRGRKK